MWSAKQIEGCGEFSGCGCEELWVWGGACEEVGVGVGRWVCWCGVWGGGCAEVGVVR